MRYLSILLIVFSIKSLSWNPELYRLNDTLQTNDYEYFLKKHSFNVMPEQILDLGTRTNKNFSALTQMFPKSQITSIVIDPVFKVLTDIRNVSINHDINNLDSIEEKKYDLIFSAHYLHWIKEQNQTDILEKVYYTLNTDGNFLGFISPKKDPERPFEQIKQALMNNEKYKPIINLQDHRTLYTLEEYKAKLECVGFIVEEIGYHRRKRQYQNISQLKGSIKAWFITGNEFIEAKNPELIDQYFDDLSTRLFEILETDNQNGKKNWYVDVLYFRAKKS